MWRSLHNSLGVMGLSLANLGLFLASGMLLAFIIGGVYGGFWERSAELEATAVSFNTIVETVNAAYSDARITVRFPQHPILQHVTCSTQYLSLAASGGFRGLVSVTQRWVVSAWPRENASWRSGEDLHRWLNETSGHSGTFDDPVNGSVLSSLREDWNASVDALALEPIALNPAVPVVVEKVFVYGGGGERVSFVVVYQVC